MRLPKPKAVACLSCNARKVKCSGGTPCKNCNTPGDCIYPPRDRQVKVSQSYLDRILRENEQLKSKVGRELRSNHRTQDNAEPVTSHDGYHHTSPESAKNPMLQDQPWFANFLTSDTPIWIGEASDAAFATRLAQLLAAPDLDPGHLPRTSYVTDAQLLECAAKPSSWPTPGKARFLVQAALQSLKRCYHIVRASQILGYLERNADNEALPNIAQCKLYAMFAIGELYSFRLRSCDEDFPGLAYFSKASRMLGSVHERPDLEVVETTLLLSFYSLQVNRRHAAYTLAGSAVRLAMVMGLHLSAEVNIQDSDTQEHRKRVWWTAYVFDRMWASKVGLPPAIGDDEIFVQLPVSKAMVQCDDFLDHEFLIATIRLARLAGDIISAIYRRNEGDKPFSRRVHATLQQLHAWAANLPNHLQLTTHQGASDALGRAVSLHLSFNQCLILATRPILLSVLQASLSSNNTSSESDLHPDVSEIAQSISESCVSYARHSHALLLKCWINGSFHVFDKFYTQYLFSASTVLGIAALVQTERLQSDLESLEVTSGLLHELQAGGNFAAREYSPHMDRLIATIVPLCKSRLTQPALQPDTRTKQDTVISPTPDVSVAETLAFGNAENPLQSFLSDPSLEWGLLDSLVYNWE